MKVSVEFFKPTGKWYTTEEIEWIEIKGKTGNYVLRHSLRASLNGLYGMWAVCLDNPRGFPLMIKYREKGYYGRMK